MNTRHEIRQQILKQEPFCLTDLIRRLNPNNRLDNKLILTVLNQMYDERLISYIKAASENEADFGYLFAVNNEKTLTRKK